MFQLRVSGESEVAILGGVEDDKEYQISLSALYGDGAQSEAVAIRYSTCESNPHSVERIPSPRANSSLMKPLHH